MKRRIAAIAILAVLLLCGAVWARMTTVVVGQGVSAAPGCSDYTDTFTASDGTTVTGWTEVAGDWSIASNEVSVAVGGYAWRWLRYNTAMANTSQYGVIQLTSCTSGTGDDQCGIAFRWNTSSNTLYTVSFDQYNDQVAWRYHPDLTHDTTIQATAVTYADDSYLAFEVTGTGNNTVVNVWYGAHPGTRPWSNPTASFTNNPATAADDGLYVGIRAIGATSTSVTFDNAFFGPCE